MRFIRGLFGFLTGMGAGLLILAVLVAYVPQMENLSAIQAFLSGEGVAGKSSTKKAENEDKASISQASSENSSQNISKNTVQAALKKHAIAFSKRSEPLLGVILEDSAEHGVSIGELELLQTPVTIALRADDPNASARASAYHAAGFEIVAQVTDALLASLEAAATPDQVHNILDEIFTIVPHSIGLLGDETLLAYANTQSSTADVFKNSLKETGHGLIFYSKDGAFEDENIQTGTIPATTVMRVLDANNERNALIFRYLNRLSADASHDKPVLVLGSTRKDTIATLAIWALSETGEKFDIVPASALLLEN